MERAIRAVIDVIRMSGDEQSFAKNIVIEPGHWAEFDPFLMMAEDWMQTPGGFPDHPHRGFETVTLVLEGEVEHSDNHGHHGVLGPGDVQWMTAGRGVIHSEMPHGHGPAHTLQLWVNLPASHKLTVARYVDLRAVRTPVEHQPSAEIRVIAALDGPQQSPTANPAPVIFEEIRAAVGATVQREVPSEYNGFLYVLAGRGRFGVDGAPASAGQVVWLAPVDRPEAGSTITIQADEPLHLVFAAGKPIREPVFAYGPFVMNTREEIIEAFHDYQAGRFGPPTATRA